MSCSWRTVTQQTQDGSSNVSSSASIIIRSSSHSFAGCEGERAMAGGVTELPIHPLLEQSIAFLLGTWRGEGEGGFPTIQSFKYGEEIKLWHVGKPMIAYTQKTWKAASGEPMHAESGFFRPKADGSIEVVIAQSTGLVEVQKGTYRLGEKTLELRSSLVGNASKVVEISRKFTVEGDELRYTVGMGTHSHELQPHLQALLKKVPY